MDKKFMELKLRIKSWSTVIALMGLLSAEPTHAMLGSSSLLRWILPQTSTGDGSRSGATLIEGTTAYYAHEWALERQETLNTAREELDPIIKAIGKEIDQITPEDILRCVLADKGYTYKEYDEVQDGVPGAPHRHYIDILTPSWFTDDVLPEGKKYEEPLEHAVWHAEDPKRPVKTTEDKLLAIYSWYAGSHGTILLNNWCVREMQCIFSKRQTSLLFDGRDFASTTYILSSNNARKMRQKLEEEHKEAVREEGSSGAVGEVPDAPRKGSRGSQSTQSSASAVSDPAKASELRAPATGAGSMSPPLTENTGLDQERTPLLRQRHVG